MARAALGTMALVLALLLGAAEAAAAPGAIRVGGPSSPTEPKVAIVGTDRPMAGWRFVVQDRGGKVVERGKLKRAPGRADPWKHAYLADLSDVGKPGSYRIFAGNLRSRAWKVSEPGSSPVLQKILEYFRANRDGAEPALLHGPAHLHDAVIHPASPVSPGLAIDMTGGWMDAGDMLHFTQTTAFATAMLEASARLDPVNAAALAAEADVGIRWLLKAHPSPGVFVAQVGDERDHEYGFRDPTTDDASARPGIGTRFAYPEIGGDLGGKAAAALALAYVRTGNPALLAAASDWYEAGLAAGRPARPLPDAGYPRDAGEFYVAPNWKDSMAAGAAELYRASCAAGACNPRYEQEFIGFVSDSKQSGPYAAMGAVDDFASFGEAEVCGAFGGDATVFGAEARSLACGLLAENGRIAARQAGSNAFGMPGYFSWGTTAQNGAAGALAALATVAPGKGGSCRVAAGARDYLLGRNPYGASFVTGYGPKAPKHPHHWAAVYGRGKPDGSVVGGPAPVGEIRGQGFPVRGRTKRFGSEFATYEDKRANYVTSEPAIDYAAASILLLAALRAHC